MKRYISKVEGETPVDHKSLSLDEQYANWYEWLRASGAIKNSSLEEMRAWFVPVELFSDHFTVYSVEIGSTYPVAFAEEYIASRFLPYQQFKAAGACTLFCN
jgi:hypothetical protein